MIEIKKLILILLCLTFVPLASADELKIKGYIKPDPLRGGNNYLIYNKRGKATGRIAPDPLRPSNSDHYIIYDKKGNKTGQIRPDYIDNRRYIIEPVKGD
jgi:uncharacterized protein YxjI